MDLASQLLTDVLDWVEATIDNKQSDGGLVLLLKPDAITFVAGGRIADGVKLEKVIKQLAKLAADEEPDFAKGLKLDAETYEGVRFHTVAVPVPDEDAVKFFGQKIEVVVGINNQSFYLSVGRDAAKTLKQVIDDSKTRAGKQVPPARISVAATPIVEFVAEVAGGLPGMMAAVLAKQLKESTGKDHLTITSEPIPNGARVRLEIEEGLLKLIASYQKIQEEMEKMMEKMMEGMMVPGAVPDDSSF